jgi:YggT family protein
VLLIIAYILTSWIRLPYSPTLNRVQRFLYDVCEPYLRLFRRLIPSIGPIDLSPIIGILVLYILNRLIITLIDRLH